MQKKNRQGRPGTGARALQHAHARRLLLTLAGICRELRAQQAAPSAQAAYLKVERRLRAWSRAPGKLRFRFKS